MNYVLVEESIDGVASSWNDWRSSLRWSSVFVLPAWLRAWWDAFGGKCRLHLRTVRDGTQVVGLAPLIVNKGACSFIGDADVCDYQDFVVAPGRESGFFGALLDDLRASGICRLDLRPVRPDSAVFLHLVPLARDRGYQIQCEAEDVSLELDLPATWREYLSMLNNRQRHEVRRKLRHLWQAGNVEYQCARVGTDSDEHLDTFLRLFSGSRKDKADFMTARMESFFRSLARSTAELGLLRFGLLELDGVPAAMIMGFEFDGCYYLYNSAYAARFDYLSVGLLCKVLCLRESIEKGTRRWSFLKGSEPYKYRLGGQEVPLYKCRIDMA